MSGGAAPDGGGRTVLILGGYGGFGARLSRRLARAGHDVVVAGRRMAAAEAFCRATPGCRPLQADRAGDLVPAFRRFRPDLVIDAAGPFQGSGYGVPRAAIACGVPYLDLADGRAFVAGVSCLDEAARASGVAVVAGASSVPALSGAVARHLTRDLDEVRAIEMAISASNRATAGRSVATAILGAVGRPLLLWRGGRHDTAFGWQEPRRETFSVPGRAPLHGRWTALTDVPDHALLPDRIEGRPAVTFRAGTELAVQNLALWTASWPVRWGWFPSLAPLAGTLLPLQRLTRRLGTDRSAMRVRAFGTSAGRRVERRWTLVAERGDGPEIPVLAAALLATRMLAGEVRPGARDAGQDLDLADFAPLFADLAITQATEEIAQRPALYARVMGDRFARLPRAVRELHGVLRSGGAAGRARVTRGAHPLARLLARLMRFPTTGDHDLHVAFTERGGVERWVRDFSGQRFSSQMSQAGDRLVERFGPLRFAFDLVGDAGGLGMVMRGWSCAGLPLPLALAPRSAAREWEADGAFHFDVPIDLPLVGRLVRYRGWLRPVGEPRGHAPVDAAPRVAE